MRSSYAYYQSKIGIIKYTYKEKITGIELVDFIENDHKNQITDIFHKEIDQYLSGLLKNFTIYDKIEIRASDFQVRVRKELIKIPYGCTKSYKDIARAIGNPRAYQAVGSAIGANPLMIIIPCHRVIRADGSLGGYRYGQDVKRKLLQIEGLI